VLTLTTLYPSSANPRTESLLKHVCAKLRALASIDLQVVAPVPWFHSTVDRRKVWRRLRDAAARAARRRRGAPPAFPFPSHASAWRCSRVRSLRLRCVPQTSVATGWSLRFIDAHYLYPDGVAAASVARQLGRPFVVTRAASDVNLIAQMPAPRRLILAALAQAKRVIGSRGVEERPGTYRRGTLADRGAPGMALIRTCSSRADREATRARLGRCRAPSSPRSEPGGRKGHDLVLQAARRLEGAHVWWFGRGPARAHLGAVAAQLGMQERVRFLDKRAADGACVDLQRGGRTCARIRSRGLAQCSAGGDRLRKRRWSRRRSVGARDRDR